MRQATKDGLGADLSVSLQHRPLRPDGSGDGVSDPLGGLVIVDVRNVLRENAAQVALVEDEQVDEICALNAAEKPRSKCIPRVAS